MYIDLGINDNKYLDEVLERMHAVLLWLIQRTKPFTLDGCILCGLSSLLACTSIAQQPDFSSRSSTAAVRPNLIVRSTEINRAAFPVVDVHTHFLVKGKHDRELLDRYVDMMDRNGIAVCVSLDGTLWSQLDAHNAFLHHAHRDRFVVFANMDFQGKADTASPESWDCNQPDFVRRVVETLREAKQRDLVSGLKFFKDFGLRHRNADASLVRIDDLKWDPVWQVCGEIGIPVLMHTADPSAFFEPNSPENERYGELQSHPEWSFANSSFPRRKELHAARNRVIERHPRTTFIAAHFGNDAEDLAELSDWLQLYPNLMIEFASRINELGRQPYTSRAFFERFQDRILFGTDGPWPEARIHLYWRFLESFDEYFPYSEKVPPPQGNWRIYGIGLDKSILEKVYIKNAVRVIPGIQERLLKYQERQVRP